MSRRLVGAAGRGVVPFVLSPEQQALLTEGDIEGVLDFHRSRFGDATMAAGDEDEDDESDEDEDAEDGDESDEDEDEDEDEEDGDKPDAKDRRIQELSAESKKYRLKNREHRSRIAELEQENARLKSAKKVKPKAQKDAEDADAEEADDPAVEELKRTNEKLQEKLVTQQLRAEFNDLTTGSKAKHRFKNPKAAFRLLDLDEVEIDDDGDIIGLDEAIAELAKSDPYLLDKGTEEKDEDTRRRRGATGQPTGGKRKGNPNRDKLLSKYPALRR